MEQDARQLQQTLEALSQRVSDLERFQEDKSNHQLTYPIDRPSVDALDYATDLFLLDKVMNLIWKKLFHYLTTFESLDGFDALGVTISTPPAYIAIATTGVSGNESDIYRRATYLAQSTLSQPSNMRTTIYMESVTAVEVYIVVGDLTDEFYGFKIVNNSLMGVTSQAGTAAEQTRTLLTISAAQAYNIEARFTPNVGISFLVEAKPYGSIVDATKLPTGVNGTGVPQVNPILMHMKVKTNSAVIKTMRTTYFQYLQNRNVLQ